MGRPREFDEERALTAALETFWEHGYEATSLADLTERMKLQKGSLYGAFGDKRQLYLTALAHYQERGLAGLEQELGGDGSPRAALRRFFAGVVERSGTKLGPRGCLCVNTAVELGPHDDEVAESVRAYGERVDALFQGLIERGQTRREFDPKLDPTAAARFLSALLHGLAVLAKLHPPRARLEDVVRVGLAALEPRAERAPHRTPSPPKLPPSP
jgi:TetR/AcrR family transcriptional repressor of nem operon